jgi:hypothetical protein
MPPPPPERRTPAPLPARTRAASCRSGCRVLAADSRRCRMSIEAARITEVCVASERRGLKGRASQNARQSETAPAGRFRNCGASTRLVLVSTRCPSAGGARCGKAGPAANDLRLEKWPSCVARRGPIELPEHWTPSPWCPSTCRPSSPEDGRSAWTSSTRPRTHTSATCASPSLG